MVNSGAGRLSISAKDGRDLLGVLSNRTNYLLVSGLLISSPFRPLGKFSEVGENTGDHRTSSYYYIYFEHIYKLLN
jgi:hypothetical protein